jgi:ParB family chromosome partitioning protein
MRKATVAKESAQVVPIKRKSMPPVRAQLVGKVVLKPLDSVNRNPWNPNQMTPFEKQALRHGLEKDGWLVSHALTIWGHDENGVVKNLIIDGEHRWEAAKQLGMKDGPMVFLNGLTESAAKMLTVKLDQKRGRFNEDRLGALLQSVQADLNLDTQSLDLGIAPEDLSDYLRVEEEPNPVIGELPSGQKASVKTVPLYFKPEEHEAFNRLLKDLAGRFQTLNATDTVFEAVRRAHAASAPK